LQEQFDATKGIDGQEKSLPRHIGNLCCLLKLVRSKGAQAWHGMAAWHVAEVVFVPVLNDTWLFDAF